MIKETSTQKTAKELIGIQVINALIHPFMSQTPRREWCILLWCHYKWFGEPDPVAQRVDSTMHWINH